jgi:hypothetical protein
LALELKESGISLQEDSSIINIHDDPRGPFNKHRKDILSRDLKQGHKPCVTQDTPLMRNERDENQSNVQIEANYFIKCEEKDQIESDYPVLNKTSSNIVN